MPRIAKTAKRPTPPIIEYVTHFWACSVATLSPCEVINFIKPSARNTKTRPKPTQIIMFVTVVKTSIREESVLIIVPEIGVPLKDGSVSVAAKTV